MPQAIVAYTHVLKNSKNPKWDKRFIILLAHTLGQMEFQAKDNDVLDVDVLGSVKIPTEKIVIITTILGWFMMENSSNKNSKQGNNVFVERVSNFWGFRFPAIY